MVRIYHVSIILHKWLCKKPLQPEISPGRPIDFVSAAGSVRVPQVLISWSNLTLIDFLMHYKSVGPADQAIYYTDRVCCSNLMYTNLSCETKGRLAMTLWELADGIVKLVFITSLNCHMQACVGASRVKYKLRVCPGGTNLLSRINKLAEGSACLRHSC